MTPGPIRFGPPGHGLVGMLHVPAAAAARGHGVVLCNPFGQEAIRCHRLLKVIADRLAREGLHVLRFDYYGSGDSEGDDDEATLEGWLADVRLARAALEERAGVAATSLFGLRLGATAALLAAAADRPPRTVVAWDPVVSGAAYLDELRQAHAEVLERRLVPAMVEDARLEALGFPIPPALRRAIEALRPERFTAVAAGGICLVTSPEAREAEALAAALRRPGVPVRTAPIASRIVWTADSAMNSAIVPADGMQAVLDALLA